MTYRERRAARADRLREWSGKRATRSAQAFATVHRIADAIPFGQPILVGHHSERHARRDQDRIYRGMRAGVDHADKAGEMARKADEIDRQADHAIYSDDPDAIEQLTAKIGRLEDERAQMKARNTAYRAAHRAALAAMTPYERSQSVPHPAYELQNLGGNITRCRERLRLLSGTPAPEAASVPEGATATARAGLVVHAEMTTPSRPGKAPRPVWTVRGNLATWRPLLVRLDGNWYRGAFSFWDDPTAEIESACLEGERAALERHQLEDPHCTCPDCILAHAAQLESEGAAPKAAE
jgi:hypothetical protein